MGFLDLFRPRGRVIDARHPLEQAAAIATTPVPRIDDYGFDGTSQNSQFFALDGPTPAHVEWICSLSDELGRTITRLRMEVWRRGLQVTPLHPKYCENCREGIDDEVETEGELYECHLCGHVGVPADPDPAEKAQLEDFKSLANKLFREDLETVGERVTEEMLKHGRGYLVFNLLYITNDDGVVDEASLKGIYAGQSARIVPLHRPDTGIPGGKFICIKCRMKGTTYKPKEQPGRCECGYVLYEASHAQTASIFGGAYNMYWLPEEIHEYRWPYKDGTGPVRRLWPKVSTLLMMDWYAAWALDPKRDKRPDRILVTMGGDLTSIVSQLKANAELRKKNPYAYSHLHIPSPPGGMGEVKLGAEILDFGDKEFKGQMMELREKFEDATRQEYGLSSFSAGDDKNGGLGQNDTPKLRTTAQVAEDIQTLQQKGLLRLAQKLGATQWTYTFHPALEEDEARKAEDQGKWLDVGVKAAGAGLQVEWRDGKVHIQNGPIMDPNQQQQMMGGGMDEFGNPVGEEGMGFDEELPALDMEEFDGDLGEGPDGVPVTQMSLDEGEDA